MEELADEPPDLEGVDLRAVVVALAIRDCPVKTICQRLGLARSTVYRWINQAHESGLFSDPPPPRAFGVRLDCNCSEDPIKVGERLVCVNCCASGWDHHPAMHADPLPVDRKPYRPQRLQGGR